MNKLISTDRRIFMGVIGPSESGKTHLLYEMLVAGTFQPPFDKILYCYRHWQPIYDEFIGNLENIEFVNSNSLDGLVEEGSNGAKLLMIFDDVAEEILQNEKFSNLATSGRHKNISVIFIKHNLYQQGKYSVTIDKNTTHILLMKNPRIGRQIKILGTELGNVKFLEDCYKKVCGKQTLWPFFNSYIYRL